MKQFSIPTSKEKKGGDTVKKMLKLLLVGLIVLAFSGASFAQETKGSSSSSTEQGMEKKDEGKAKTKSKAKSKSKSKAKSKAKKKTTEEKKEDTGATK